MIFKCEISWNYNLTKSISRSNFSWTPNQKITLTNILVDLLMCTDNERKPESCESWVFEKLHTMKNFTTLHKIRYPTLNILPTIHDYNMAVATLREKC